MEYIENLRSLVSQQVEKYITNVMRTQSNNAYTERFNILDGKSPRYKTPSYETNSTALIGNDTGVSTNNNPEYPANMIDRLNTPFDHIERILLQDFSVIMGLDEDSRVKDGYDVATDNYFRSIFSATFNSSDEDYGVTNIGLYQGTDITNWSSSGNYFIESFTYTPFIDYAVGNDNKTGIYADELLTKFNKEDYDDAPNATESKFIDSHRRKMSSNLYTLRNLDDDLYNAKFLFRDAIQHIETDADGTSKTVPNSVFIYTFCDHLFRLFAKLSNIRMCHEVYGLQPPHCQWEGILALDIWYQMLYNAIDMSYDFDDDYLDRNPMVKLEIKTVTQNNITREYVEYLGQTLYKDSISTYKNLNGERIYWWMTDGVEDGYVLLWNNDIWDKYNTTSKSIASSRKDNVLPRGVLKSIYSIVYGSIPSSSIANNASGDFSWFYQKGKVYSDSDKSQFTRYVNLHLGRAYQVMTGKEYYDLTNTGKQTITESGKITDVYTKPAFNKERNTILRTMLLRGCNTLYDAFRVLKNEKIFNIYNSSSNQIETFKLNNANNYTQSQCAIVIERIFSRLYKYLQFKSTTTEIFQKRINIDSGYKYLTSDAILNSDHTITPYYNENDVVKYFRYKQKLSEYVSATSTVLTNDEKAVLNNAISVLETQSPSYIDNVWNICPLCQKQIVNSSASRDALNSAGADAVRLFRTNASSSTMMTRDDDSDIVKTIDVDFNFDDYMNIGSPSRPTEIAWTYDGNGRVKSASISLDFSAESFDLSIINLFKPTYTYTTVDRKSLTIKYELLGYSTQRNSRTVMYAPNANILKSDISDETYNIHLYAVWRKQYIIKFNKGITNTATGTTVEQLITAGVSTKLNKCGFSDNTKMAMFTYYNNALWENTPSQTSGESVYLRTFKNWTYQNGASSVNVNDQGKIYIPEDYNSDSPFIVLTANWKTLYNVVPFLVEGQKFCDGLVATSDNIVNYPDYEPVMASPKEGEKEMKFVGWDIPDGTVIQGADQSPNVVCDGSGNILICEQNTSADQIVCFDDSSIGTLDLTVNALLAEAVSNKYHLVFNFLTLSDGNIVETSVTEEVSEKQKIPEFHIHSTLEVNDEETAANPNLKKYKKFRYWKLASGNITSSLNIMSDAVMNAVYDDIAIENPEDKTEIDQAVPLTDIDTDTREEFVEPSCQYVSSEVGKDGWYYCTFNGAYPRNMDSSGTLYDATKVYADCPLLNMMCRPVSNKNDFYTITLLEISDIDLLLKALLKVNIDIAHNEYFLKTSIPEDTDWWYGYTIEKSGTTVCNSGSTTICNKGSSADEIVSNPFLAYISFEPTVEYKFSNLHAANQIDDDGKLVCTWSYPETTPHIIPVNRELLEDNGIHYSDFLYCYDYEETLANVSDINSASVIDSMNDAQKYYDILPLHMYVNSGMQSPTDVNDYVKHRIMYYVDGNEVGIPRTNKQVQTFTSIVKKYRPVIVPQVRDIFNDCFNDDDKYTVDQKNTYGIFGWCTIPSKTMVNMEYNEGSIIIPSSYDHHNRVGGSNFLQIDPDFDKIYNGNGSMLGNIKNTWYYLYNQRDWTYFLEPFFDIKVNNDIYSNMQDEYEKEFWPDNSNHLNGVIFEPSNLGRETDSDFGDEAMTCRFLAQHHHGEHYLELLTQNYSGLFKYSKLLELTSDGTDLNSIYGTQYENLPTNFRYLDVDWVDDYDKTSAYVNNDTLYKYNLGQRTAIDDGDEDSVWLYITMTSPLEEVNQVIEIEDIMPFVFWWSNRGGQNNGPTVDCYGLQSNAKLNYEDGYCYEGSFEHESAGNCSDSNCQGGEDDSEERWHAVKSTLGIDFSKKDYGGAIVTQDNSGNVWKEAFDPTCAGTNEKWKVHHPSNAFGANQHEDPSADKYWTGVKSTAPDGGGTTIPADLNNPILDSLKFSNTDTDKPMTWNLWNCIRHYVYIKYYKNYGKKINGDASWNDIEKKTKKLVKAIYRTYVQNQTSSRTATFGDVDESMSNGGDACIVQWTNSFIQVCTVLERNAREHEASFALFTGHDVYDYHDVREHTDNFVVTTLAGVDSDEDGINQDVPSDRADLVYNGKRYENMPATYILGDSLSYNQRDSDITITFSSSVNFDSMYPESEYYLNDSSKKWVRQISDAVMSKQIFPIYTSMETLTKNDVNHTFYNANELTVEQMKSITFQVVPQMYWKYEWSYNDLFIHPVGRLNGTGTVPMYDMIGNVWEWVRDDWSVNVSDLNGKTNPIAGDTSDSIDNTGDNRVKKVIKGGGFDQFARKNISGSREGIYTDQCVSEFGSQANVGFRPSLQYTYYPGGTTGGSGFDKIDTPVDLFFLFDASASEDKNIEAMLESAKKIVRRFAGNSQNKDQCKVGSALFLGPTIKFMCAKNFASFTNFGYVGKSVSSTDSKSEYKDGMAAWNAYEIRAAADWVGTTGISEERRALNRFRLNEENLNNVWNNQIKPRAYSTSSIKDISEPVVMMSRDGGSSGHAPSGGGSSSGESVHEPKYSYPTKYIWVADKDLYGFQGVSAWYEGSDWETGTLHFNDGESSAGEECFFNYDPTPNGISTFEFPTIQTRKGYTATFWTGVEPVFRMVNQLECGGLFDMWNGQIKSNALGYVFRGPDIPKLVFVFVNEFDNSLHRTKTWNGSEAQVYPWVDRTSTTVRSKDASGTWVKTTTYSYPVKLEEVYMTNKSGSTKTQDGDWSIFLDGADQNPPDPYCLQLLGKKQLQNIWDFVAKIGITDGMTNGGTGAAAVSYLTEITTAINGLSGGADYKFYGQTLDNLVTYTVKSHYSYKVSNPGNISVTGVKEADVNNLKPVINCDTPLSFKQYCSANPGKFPGYGIDEKNSASDKWKVSTVTYETLHTQDYYSLLTGMQTNSNTFNTYFMVSDANAPQIIENYPLLANDARFFKDIWTTATPSGTALADPYYKKASCAKWGTLVKANCGWHAAKYQARCKDKDKVIKNRQGDVKNMAKAIDVIFGLNNPYKSMRMVWAIRTAKIQTAYKKELSRQKTAQRKGTTWTPLYQVIGLSNEDYVQCCSATSSNVHNVSKNANKTYLQSFVESPLHTDAWKAKHMCTLYDFENRGCTTFTDDSGNTQYAISRRTLDQTNMNIVIYYYDEKRGDFTIEDTCLIKQFYSSESLVTENSGEGLYAFNSDDASVVEYITIPYAGGGGLKIIVMPDFNKVGANQNVNITMTYSDSSLTYTLLKLLSNTEGVDMPDLWYEFIDARAYELGGDTCIKQSSWWESQGFLDADKKASVVTNLYAHILKALPVLMAYKYQLAFDDIKNGFGKQVTDYDDEDNTLIFKALPIDNSNSDDVFRKFGYTWSGSQFKGSFSYSHAIIDLLPSSDNTDYAMLFNPNIQSGDDTPTQEYKTLYKNVGGKYITSTQMYFPLSFSNVQDVNAKDSDTNKYLYKTSKIVLSRLDKISSDNQDDNNTFTMGVKTTDYDEITDKLELKYADREVKTMMAQAPGKDYRTGITGQPVPANAVAEVTLLNGGSYQKETTVITQYNDKTGKYDKIVNAGRFYSMGHPASTSTDKTQAAQENAILNPYNETYKYLKDKHCFIDPFELTIAQWCYVNGASLAYLKGYSSKTGAAAAKAKAIDILDDKYTEMATSYYGYLNAFEGYSYTEAEIAQKVSNNDYNPLEDERPYYYATYKDVRGTTQVYATPTYQDSRFLLSNKGDEYQMNTRTETTSFMDKLNSMVVLSAPPRTYHNQNGSSYPVESLDSTATSRKYVKRDGTTTTNLSEAFNITNGTDGGRFLDKYRYSLIKNKLSESSNTGIWCSGEACGLNFDLPTEAQWEYACRQTDSNAFPSTNLGNTYQTNHVELDLIAWYKYRIIGKLPEPERFCAWRISKMLFGIKKDKDQVNAVYETTDS